MTVLKVNFETSPVQGTVVMNQEDVARAVLYYLEHVQDIFAKPENVTFSFKGVTVQLPVVGAALPPKGLEVRI